MQSKFINNEHTFTHNYNLLSLEPFLIYSGNKKFLDGSARWTEQRTNILHYIYIGILFALLFILVILFYFFIVDVYSKIQKLLILFIFFCITILLFVYSFKLLRREEKMVKNGFPIPGKILSFERLLSGPSESQEYYYIVSFSFLSPQNKIITGKYKVAFPANETLPIGKKIIILYLNDKEFTPL